MAKDQPLADRVAIVTGAAQGLGRGIARRLAQEGAIVVCTDVLDCAPAVDAIAAATGRTTAWHQKVDVSDAGAIRSVVGAAIDRHGHIDILVNNAAIIQPATDVIDLADDIIDRVIAVNLRGLIEFSRVVGAHMRERRSGRIINISSQVGKLAWPGLGVYAATKAGVVALTQAMALELAPHGVFVNAICPGTMDTEQARYTFRTQAARTGRPIEELVEERRRSMPLGRLGTPEDAGALVAWLASDEASFTVGTAFNLTGGEYVGF